MRFYFVGGVVGCAVPRLKPTVPVLPLVPEAGTQIHARVQFSPLFAIPSCVVCQVPLQWVVGCGGGHAARWAFCATATDDAASNSTKLRNDFFKRFPYVSMRLRAAIE
jgi:hypothetical protein